MGYWSHWILSAALVSALAGCASPGSTNQALLPSSWPDARYGYDPSLIREDATTLLELDAPLIAQLHSDAVQNLSTERRTQYLLAQLLGPQSTPFTYRYGQSTPARQTWYDRQGDCLSLTVLALAMAQHLRLNAIVQEVSVPANYNRRQGVDFRSGHVNLFIDRGTVTDAAAPIGFSPGLVVDFEPVEGTIRRGRPLKLDALLARYYNNAGAQALADAAQRQATETRLRLLESQLEPHMLFNTLANLRALIGVDPGRAQAMLDRMIDFLRATLSASRAPLPAVKTLVSTIPASAGRYTKPNAPAGNPFTAQPLAK